MSDSLLFDGTDDIITCAVGGTPTFGPGMIAVILKPGAISANRDFINHGIEVYRDGTNDRPGTWDGSNTSVAVDAAAVLTDDIWYLVAATKATGSAAPRFHVYNYNTTTWAHSSGNQSIPNKAAGSNVYLGGSGAGGFHLGNILIAGIWNSDFADAAVEALGLETGIAAWVTAAPLEAWRLNTTSAIQSFGSTGTADESSRVGTTLDTGDVPAGTWDVGNEKTGAGVVGP